MPYSASDINKLLLDYFKTDDGKELLKANGIAGSSFTEDELVVIAEDLKNEIISKFISITSHASRVDAEDYFSNVKIGKIQHLKTGDKVTIRFGKKALYRPSLVKRNGKSTGNGINDIFALITNGTSKKANLYGYWTYASQGMGYDAEEYWTKAWLPRVAKPFISEIIHKYEAKYPGIKITYPDEWK